MDNDNLQAFAKALMAGERKWSDIHLHPNSTPGRYVTNLDLQFITDQCSELGKQILNLVPNVRHLGLAGGEPLPLTCLQNAPCLGRLRSLTRFWDYDVHKEGVSVNDVLRQMPNLEFLHISGWGYPQGEGVESIKLDKLHTLIVSGACGPLLESLAISDLPSLNSLSLDSLVYTNDFQLAHGHKLRTLLYFNRENPPILDHILHIQPNLVHLGHYIRYDFAPLVSILANAREDCPLETIGVVRWATGSDIWEDDTMPQARINALRAFKQLIESGTLKHLRALRVEEFHWLNPDLGSRALDTGVSGGMRAWSEKLKKIGIQLLDSDDKPAPIQEECSGSRRSFGPGPRGWTRPDQLEEDGG